MLLSNPKIETNLGVINGNNISILANGEMIITHANVTYENIPNITLEKKNIGFHADGIENELFYNIQVYEDVNNDIILEADINRTVYNFLKDAYLNPNIQKCNIIKEYLNETKAKDWTCIQIRDYLTSRIQTGWRFYKNNFEKGTIEVNRTHVIINFGEQETYDDIMKLGENSITISSVVYFNPTPTVKINGNITLNNINKVIYNWNGTNFTFYGNGLLFAMNFENRSELNENSTYIVDIARGLNNGTMPFGGTINSSGKYNKGFLTDGDNDYINAGTSPAGNLSAITVSAWIKVPNNGANQIIIEDGRGYNTNGFYMYLSTGKPEFEIYDGGYDSFTSTNSVNSNEWTHIIGTWQAGSRAKVYVNGILSSGSSSGTLRSGTLAYGNDNLTIGGRPATSPTWLSLDFNGTIDEVKIWNKSLSETEIYEVYVSSIDKINLTSYTLFVNQSKNATAGLTNGTYSYRLYAHNISNYLDDSGEICVAVGDGFSCEEEPPDIEYPIFYNYWDNNATLTSSGLGKFNITVNNTNGTVILNINGQTILATNLTNNIYNASYNFSSSGIYIYNWTAYGNGTSHNINISQNRYYTVNSSPVSDTSYPIFSNNINNPLNSSIWTSNGNYQFNITIVNTNGTAGIQFNNINYSLTNTSSNYSKIFSSLSAGTIGYYYWAYGNGTDKLYNKTQTYSYQLNKTSPIYGMNITGTTPITYTTTSNYIWSENNTGDSDVTYSMNYANQVFGVGTWNFNYSTTGGANYTGGSVNKTLTVNKNTTALSLIVTSPITYGTTSDFTGSGCNSEISCSLNITNQVFGAGTVNANYSTLGNANYTGSSATATLIINKVPSQTSLTFDKTSPQIYETQVTPTCSLISGDGSLTLTNGTSGSPRTYGVGTWWLNCSTTGNQNYSGSSNQTSFVISQNSSYVLGITGTTPITYGTTSDYSGVGCPTQITCSMDKSNAIFGVGTITFNYSTSGNTNYSGKSTTKDLVVNKATGIVYAYINQTRINKNYLNGSIVMINGSLITGLFGSINLTINNVGVNFSTSNNISYSQTFTPAGSYIIKANYSGNQNYTEAFEQWTLTISNPSTPSTGGNVTQCRYKKFGFYNTKLPWFREVNCI